jgi:adenosylcobinamide kinase/adenosylcobinamide-phosphate guanylyltransferase
MAGLTLIVGGARSGKSRFAEQLASALPPVTYLATAAHWPGDAEMAARLARHRARRAAFVPPCRTIEESRHVAEAVLAHGQIGCVIVECLTLWLTTLLDAAGLSDAEVLREVSALAEAGQKVPARVLVVSNEVGCGIVPDNPLARRFTDVLGEANQMMAAAATEVYGCLAGLVRRWKPV